MQPSRLFIYVHRTQLDDGPRLLLTGGGFAETGAYLRVTGTVCRTKAEPPEPCVIVDQIEVLGAGAEGAMPSSTPGSIPATEPTGAPTYEPSPEEVPVELREAIKTGLVTAKGTGRGLERLDLEITSKAEQNLIVTIELGTVLAPKTSGTQNMVVVSDASLELEPGSSDTVVLDVACGQMHDDQPTGSDTFKVQMLDPKADLLKLLRLDTFGDEDFRVQQFAIWTITDNPSRNNYQGLGTTFDVFGTGPTADEMSRIKSLFKAAGISTGHYRAF